MFDDLDLPPRLIRLETRVENPIRRDREILQSCEITPPRTCDVAHPYPEFSRPLDDEEAQRTTRNDRG